MSLVNVFVGSDKVVFLTDTAIYDATGRVLQFMPKCIPVDSWTGAITFRGAAWGIGAALRIAERYSTFDEFLARSGPEIERAHRAALAEPHLDGQTMIELYVAGWSEHQDRPRALMLKSDDAPRHPGDLSPSYLWKEHEGPAYHLEFDLMGLCRLHMQGAEPDQDWTPETFDPQAHGIPLAEEQRRTPADAMFAGPAAGRYVIGGALMATTITRHGVDYETLRTWSDDVGEHIQPAPFDSSGLPKVVPLGIPWSYRKFMAAVEMGAIDVQTLAFDREKLKRLEAVHGR